MTDSIAPKPGVSIRRIAYHEAGHAVACLANGVQFEYVTSMSRERNAGCIRLVPGQESRGDRDFAWVLSSGVIADRINRGRDDFTANTIRNWHRYGWLESDIRTLITEFTDKTRLLALVKYVAEMTRAYWPAVEGIAQALMEPTTLGHSDARRLFLAVRPGLDIGQRDALA